MKVTFYCDNRSTLNNKLTETFDTGKHFLMSDEDWLALTEDEKLKMVEEWMWERMDFWFDEVK